MSEEIVEEIYSKLIERFGISEVFLPKYRKSRLQDITWKSFIKAALEASTLQLAIYCGYSGTGSFKNAMKKYYSSILKAKEEKEWFVFLSDIVSKKRCSSCKVLLSHDNFSLDCQSTDNLQAVCKQCGIVYRKENQYTIADYKKVYYQENKEKLSLYGKQYREVNKVKISLLNKEYGSRYRQEHKAEHKAKNAKYRASKFNATPNWANLITIKEIYRTCPEGYHVDHIIPLQHTLVCGLHCEFNLQHLPARENLSKGNKFEID